MTRARFLLSGALSLAASFAVAAQETAAPPAPAVAADNPANSSKFGFRFTGGAWFPRVRGDISNGGPDLSVEDVGLSGSETAPALDLEIRYDRLTADLTGFTFSTSGSGVVPSNSNFGAIDLPAGSVVATDFDIDSAGVDFTYALWQPIAVTTPQSGDPRRLAGPGTGLTISPLVGGRWYGLSQQLSVPGGGSASGGGDWGAILFGGRIDIDLVLPADVPMLHAISVCGLAGYGPAFGSDIGTALVIRADLTLWFTPNFGVTGGYRYQGLDLQNDDWAFNGSLAGLFVSGTIRF